MMPDLSSSECGFSVAENALLMRGSAENEQIRSSYLKARKCSYKCTVQHTIGGKASLNTQLVYPYSGSGDVSGSYLILGR